MSTMNIASPENTNTDKKDRTLADKLPSMHINFIVKDIALKTLLFSMVFYVVNSKLMLKFLSCLNNYPWIEVNLVQSIIFAIIFYIISVNL